jgi:hypothetical protein
VKTPGHLKFRGADVSVAMPRSFRHIVSRLGQSIPKKSCNGPPLHLQSLKTPVTSRGDKSCQFTEEAARVAQTRIREQLSFSFQSHSESLQQFSL